MSVPEKGMNAESEACRFETEGMGCNDLNHVRNGVFNKIVDKKH